MIIFSDVFFLFKRPWLKKPVPNYNLTFPMFKDTCGIFLHVNCILVSNLNVLAILYVDVIFYINVESGSGWNDQSSVDQ